MKFLNNFFLPALFKMSLTQKNNFELFLPHLKENYIIDEAYQKIWSISKYFYITEEKHPRIPFLIQYFNDNKSELSENCIDTLVSIRDYQVEDEDQIKEAFALFIKQSKFIALYEEAGELFNQGKKQAAYESFSQNAEEIANFKLEKAKFINIFGDFEQRSYKRNDSKYANKQTKIPTGFDFIDKATVGGLLTGETEAWLGDSGVGKSKLLVTRGISSARRGFNVLHIQLEGTEEQCTANYDACWTGLNYSDIRIGRVGEEVVAARSKIGKSILNKSKGEVRVKVADQFGGASIQDIRNWCIEYIAQYGKLDHLIIDYLELLEISGMKFDYGGGDTAKLIKLGRLIKNIAVEFNILVTTAYQTSDVPPELTKQPDFVLTRHNTGKSKRAIEPFTYFFTINQTPDEKKSHICRVYEEKYREHFSGGVYRIKQNLGKSRFYDKKGTALLELLDQDE